MLEDLVVVVDKFGNPIGTEDKLDAHRMGFRHLAFSVMLYRYRDGELEFLMQKRASNKYHSGGLWSNTCCSHPRPDEDILHASKRRLEEELGIQDPLSFIDIGTISYLAKFDNGLTENELDHIVIAQINDVTLDINPREAEACEWQTLSTIEQTIVAQPQAYTAWFKLVLNKVTAYLND
ncbi:isopentenyl-diphosphate delta-isomerase [Vibrio maritimus]|uniref:Isopentenyl-diphosphate Delta-isomerase n=1 Tax=Vibrio maritimus TaxID=990268 RepID=A0A090T2Y0_9VIBR|nr:isopentenyl-diphosphate delta-isomerase [Vibrio maritimus]